MICMIRSAADAPLRVDAHIRRMSSISSIKEHRLIFALAGLRNVRPRHFNDVISSDATSPILNGRVTAISRATDLLLTEDFLPNLTQTRKTPQILKIGIIR